MLTAYAAEVRASGIREIFDLASGRDDVLHLELGEPDFPTPPHVVAAAFEAAQRGSGYTQTAGTWALREAAARRLERVHGMSYEPSQVMVTHGAVQAVAAVVAGVIGRGDEALVPDPGWPNYEMSVVAHGGVVVRYPLRPENGFVPDVADIRSSITERTRLLVLNSPGNPTGTIVPPTDVEQIVTTAVGAGVLVLSDEVYDELIFDGGAVHWAGRYDPERVVGVWSCSKSYAMTGWRVGFLAGAGSLVRAFTTLQEPMISCVSSVTQAAALAALTGPQDCIAAMREAYEHRRDLVVGMLRRSGIDPVVPSGAFYLMLPLVGGADSRRAALDLVPCGVAVAPGTAFGDVGASHLRLSLAAGEETLVGAVDRIVAWYDKTQGGLGLP